MPEDRRADISGSAFVFVGDFNPRIFQPFWFADNGLVTATEAEDAEPIVTPDFSEVTFDWFALQAFRERVTITSRDETESARRVRDLVVDVFSILHHTPIRLLGMNHQSHLWLRSGGWRNVAEALAPAKADLLPDQELATYTVAASRDDDLAGTRRVTVEPSGRITGGVWMHFNSHVELGEISLSSAKRAVDVIQEYWEASVSDAQQVADTLRVLASNGN